MNLRTAALLFLFSSLTLVENNGDVCAGEISEAELFSDDQLLRVEITVSEAHWDRLRSQGRSIAQALNKEGPGERPFTYFPGDVSINGVKMEQVGIRKKGFLGSLDQTRPSLKIKFNEFRDNGRIGRIDRLTLNNNKQDNTNCFAFVGYRLYRKAGLPAPRCGLAVVTVNGEMLGVYSNVESIRKPFLKNEFGADDGNLYEGTYPVDFYPDRIERFEAKTNEERNDRTHLLRIAQLLENPGDDLPNSLAGLIDIDQFHTFWALESLIGFWDGYCANSNNYFVYVSSEDAKLRFIPWGLDSAFSESLLSPFNPGPASVKAKGLLPFRLYQIPEIREKHLETLRGLLDSLWKEKELVAEIDRVSEMIKDHRHPDQGEGKSEINRMKGFIGFRRRQIENEVRNGPVEYTTPPPTPTYAVQTAELQGSFSTVWADKMTDDRFETGKAELKLTVKDQVIEFKRIGVIAEPAPPPGFGRRPPVAPPALTYTAERKSDGKTLKLWVTFPTSQFQPGDGERGPVQGIMMEERNFFTIRFMHGTAVLDKAERKNNAPVEGTFDGQLFRIKAPVGRR